MLDNVGLLAALEWQRQECMRLYPDRHIELEAGIVEEEIRRWLQIVSAIEKIREAGKYVSDMVSTQITQLFRRKYSKGVDGSPDQHQE